MTLFHSLINEACSSFGSKLKGKGFKISPESVMLIFHVAEHRRFTRFLQYHMIVFLSFLPLLHRI